MLKIPAKFKTYSGFRSCWFLLFTRILCLASFVFIAYRFLHLCFGFLLLTSQGPISCLHHEFSLFYWVIVISIQMCSIAILSNMVATFQLFNSHMWLWLLATIRVSVDVEISNISSHDFTFFPCYYFILLIFFQANFQELSLYALFTFHCSSTYSRLASSTVSPLKLF